MVYEKMKKQKCIISSDEHSLATDLLAMGRGGVIKIPVGVGWGVWKWHNWQPQSLKLLSKIKSKRNEKHKSCDFIVAGFLMTAINNSQIEHCSWNIQSISYKNNIFRESESER